MSNTAQKHIASDGRRPAFTLIELLVVVAIIALLISILLPSLSKARSQARTTLCASRLAQMTKAMIIYAEDYAETPPFILKGTGEEEEYNDDPTDPPIRRKETWLADGLTMERIFAMREEDWYTEGHARLPNSGDLFDYARFDKLYRCPEFERINNEDKYQNAFNYTRSIAGRKIDVDHLISSAFDNVRYLEIIKMSAPHNPARLPMMFDEAWDCYVAWPIVRGWVWGGIDPVCDIWNSCIGQYHGAPQPGWAHFPESEPPGSIRGALEDYPVQSGMVSYYDGHTDLMRDPIPNLEHEGGRISLDIGELFAYLGSGTGPSWYGVYLRWISDFLYSQQGMALPF